RAEIVRPPRTSLRAAPGWNPPGGTLSEPLRPEQSVRHSGQEAGMQVLINSNNSIRMSEALQQRCAATVEGALQRFSEQLTRVEVHLTDENGEKSGAQDKR